MDSATNLHRKVCIYISGFWELHPQISAALWALWLRKDFTLLYCLVFTLVVSINASVSWKNSSPKLPVICRAGHKTVHSLMPDILLSF